MFVCNISHSNGTTISNAFKFPSSIVNTVDCRNHFLKIWHWEIVCKSTRWFFCLLNSETTDPQQSPPCLSHTTQADPSRPPREKKCPSHISWPLGCLMAQYMVPFTSLYTQCYKDDPQLRPPQHYELGLTTLTPTRTTRNPNHVGMSDPSQIQTFD